MIQTLKIQNLQSHKDSTLEFVPGVNVIVGLSDTGKSAVMNALYWVVNNRPTGDSYLSFWDGTMQATVTVDGKNIVRLKDKTRNEYAIDSMVFKAIRTEVPQEIVQLLNVSEINFKRQADDFFLLKNTPGEVSSHFNRMAHLEKIDTARNNIESWINQLNIKIGHEATKDRPATGLIEDLICKEKELKEFNYLDMMEQDIEVLEQMQRDLISKVQSKNILETLIVAIEEVTELIGEQAEIIKAEKQVDTLLALISQRDQTEQKLTVLDSLLDDIFSTNDDYEMQLKTAEELQNKFNKAMPETCPLCGQKIKKL